jgi:hypothetical protein
LRVLGDSAAESKPATPSGLEIAGRCEDDITVILARIPPERPS